MANHNHRCRQCLDIWTMLCRHNVNIRLDTGTRPGRPARTLFGVLKVKCWLQCGSSCYVTSVGVVLVEAGLASAAAASQHWPQSARTWTPAHTSLDTCDTCDGAEQGVTRVARTEDTATCDKGHKLCNEAEQSLTRGMLLGTRGAKLCGTCHTCQH